MPPNLPDDRVRGRGVRRTPFRNRRCPIRFAPDEFVGEEWRTSGHTERSSATDDALPKSPEGARRSVKSPNSDGRRTFRTPRGNRRHVGSHGSSSSSEEERVSVPVFTPKNTDVSRHLQSTTPCADTSLARSYTQSNCTSLVRVTECGNTLRDPESSGVPLRYRGSTFGVGKGDIIAYREQNSPFRVSSDDALTSDSESELAWDTSSFSDSLSELSSDSELSDDIDACERSWKRARNVDDRFCVRPRAGIAAPLHKNDNTDFCCEQEQINSDHRRKPTNAESSCSIARVGDVVDESCRTLELEHRRDSHPPKPLNTNERHLNTEGIVDGIRSSIERPLSSVPSMCGTEVPQSRPLIEHSPRRTLPAAKSRTPHATAPSKGGALDKWRRAPRRTPLRRCQRKSLVGADKSAAGKSKCAPVLIDLS